MATFYHKIGILVAAASCVLASCSGPPVIPGEDFIPEEVKYAGEVGRDVKKIPGIYEYHWGYVEYKNFETLLAEEREKDRTRYRDLPDLLRRKKEQGLEVDAFTLAEMEKHLNAAVGWLKEATEKNQKMEEAFLYLGVSCYHLQRYEDALTALRRFVEIHPKAPNTYVTMAMCYLNMGKTKEALECASQALKIDPDNNAAQLVIQEIQESVR